MPALSLVRQWAEQQDDDLVPALLQLPPVPEAANLVARTCLARPVHRRLPKLLLMYVPFMQGDVMDRMHECVQDGLRLEPAAHWCEIAMELPYRPDTASAVVHVIAHAECDARVKHAAAHAIVNGVCVHTDSLVRVLPQLCELAPDSVDAALLIRRIARTHGAARCSSC